MIGCLYHGECLYSMNYVVDGVLIGSFDLYCGHISSLIIAEQYRGKGHGKIMMALTLAEAYRLGHRKLTLAVAPDNVVAKAVYEFAGFKYTDKPRYSDRGNMRMERPL